MFKKLAIVVLVAVGTVPATAWAACGDLLAVSEAVPALCLRLQADRSSSENEIALVLIARGDWSWFRVEDADQCALRIEISGRINAGDYHRSDICPIQNAGEYVACLERSLTHREQATCHLRHVAR